MPILAPTTFQTGADDALEVIDVYNQTGVSTLNSIQNATQSVGAMTLDLLKKKEFIFNLRNALLHPNFKDILKGMILNNPELYALFKGLSASYQLTMANIKALKNLVHVTTAGAKLVFSSATYSDIYGLTRMSHAVCRDSTRMTNYVYRDTNTMVHFGTHLVVEAGRLGIPGVYKTFSGSPAFEGEPMLEITRNICADLINMGNNALVGEVVDNGGGAYLLQANPGFISDYLSQYQAQFETQSECWKATGNYRDQEWPTLEAIFNSLDPNWKETLRQNGYYAVIDLSKIVDASDPFFACLVLAMYENAPSINNILSQEMSGSQLRRINSGTGLNNAYYLSLMQHLPRHDPMASLKREFPKNIRL